MEGNYKKWINRFNSKQDVLTEDNVGQFMDVKLSTKSTPTSGDTVLGRDSLTGKAVEIPTSSLGGGGGDLSNYYTKDETYSKTEIDDIISDIPVVDTSNLVPYNGANKDVNISSNYFKTSKGFDFTKDDDNFFRVYTGNDGFNYLEYQSKDNRDDNSRIIYCTISPEDGFRIDKKDNNGLYLNFFQVYDNETYSSKPFVSDVGFKTPNGTPNQALTANGGTFDLTTKADLVGGKVPSSQLPSSNKTTFTHDILVSNWSLVSGKYEAVISNSGILANSFVDVIPSNDNVDIVRAAQIYPSVLISEGSVKVYSKFLPSGTISVTVNIN